MGCAYLKIMTSLSNTHERPTLRLRPIHPLDALDPAMWALRGESPVVRTSLERYESGLCGLDEALRDVFQALCQERESLGRQLEARGYPVPGPCVSWPSGCGLTQGRLALLRTMVAANRALAGELAEVEEEAWC